MSSKDGNSTPPSPLVNGHSTTSLSSTLTSDSGVASLSSKTRADVFEFTVPPEAPVFHPTESEFADPLVYIDKIRPVAEKYGICKIKPPANWQPPFAVDVDKLKFTPRIQRLNELEAKTRIKLNFLDQIAKFWELQGSSLKIPMVEKRALDLYTLHRLVESEGGFSIASKERKWAKIAVFMGYPHGKGTGTILKTHYERLLFPFELFKTEKRATRAKFKSDIKKEVLQNCNKSDDLKLSPKSEDAADLPPPLPAIKDKKNGYTRRKARSNCDLKMPDLLPIVSLAPFDLKKVKKEASDDEANAKEASADKITEQNELKRLQFYGAGPKMAGYNIKKKLSEEKTRGKVIDFHFDFDPLAKYICHNCRRGDSEEHMLLCDGCDDSYHTFCLMPPLGEIPKGDWCCPKCVATEVSKPLEAFGFEQAQREYNLQQFGEMADTFKSEYFNMPVHLVPTPMVEQEFWRIVSSIDEDVTVEYGADLHTMDHGSGFPTKNSRNLLPGDEEYAFSGWNLNNLPVLEGSVLGYINADISGMKVPWMYVGMCFATFCWHNEDHWSYSINYLHWGEPKTWYGVSGTKAELFEETMKSAAPELFQTQPDLLHQLVTIMNPNILMNAGVPVYRTDQQAGEFVITFPRAYHAGFNQGYNFAEAVNFAPADWISMGRECVLHYSQLRRFCVFSHDELVCKMAMNSEKLEITVAGSTYSDMLRMVETEKKLRKSLLDWGVTCAEREAFELLPDDERQCEVCKTTCFMSALTCNCTAQVLVCLRHYTSLCKCAPNKHTLRYRYTLDELLPLLRNLKQKAESFDRWADRVKHVLDRKNPRSIDMIELKALLAEADGKKFPKSDLLETLANSIEDAEKCASVIRQLDLNKVRTRNSYDNKSKLTIEELRLFCEEIDSLACVLDEEDVIKELLNKTNQFEKESDRILALPLKDCLLNEVEALIESSNTLCIDLPMLRQLRDRINQLIWLRDIYAARKRTQDIVDCETLKELLRKGFSLPADPVIENVLTDVQSIITDAEDWEEKTQNLFKKTSCDLMSEAEQLIKDASKIDVYLPSENLLVDSVNNVNDWFKQLQDINSLEFYPYLTAIDELVKKSKNFPFHLDEVERLKSYISSAIAWKDKTSKTFLRKNSAITLMEALSPRNQMIATNKGRKRNNEDCIRLGENMDPASVVAAFKEAEDREMRLIRNLRAVNLNKSVELNSDATFCICQKSYYGIMMQCDLCKDWFHSTCVQLPKLAATRSRKNIKTAALQLGFKDCKFLCANCLRTRRPKLETILGLLMSLQKLHSRLPEGEALQCLTERAMNWQDRARQLLTSADMTPIILKYAAINKRHAESTNKIPDQLGDVQKILIASEKTRLDDSGAESLLEGIVIDADYPDQFNPDPDYPDTSTITMSSDDEDCKDEHAYSMHLTNKSEDSYYHLPMSTMLRNSVEELVNEGDLLEVTLDENNQLWQLLFLSRDLDTDALIIDFNLLEKIASRKGRKRRSEDEGELKQKKMVNKKINNKIPRKIKEITTATATAVSTTTTTATATVTTTGVVGSPTKPLPRKRGKRGRAKANANLSDDEEAENEAKCAVSTCLQPTGDEVDWVQCDGGCEQWFHMACVGLSVKDINEDEDYICSTCSPESVKQRLSLTANSNDMIIEF